jgi:LysR family transcriptional regulator, regulator of gene expression of beta-lactamase
MERSQLPLNALRAFEAAARHLSFTRAAAELCVSQGALSHQIKSLEARLGVTLFRRLPRGVTLTDEGLALIPSVEQSFDRMADALDLFARRQTSEVVTLGVVSTFAVGWLLPRLPAFAAVHPDVAVRVMTHNNRPDMAGEGLSYAIRFGDGNWHGIASTPIMAGGLTLMAAPVLAAELRNPGDAAKHMLLRSFRRDEWPRWFAAEGLTCPKLNGPVFDTSLAIAHAAAAGLGIGLLPPAMFAGEMAEGRLAAPFARRIDTGSYWLTRLATRSETPGMAAFRRWITTAAALNLTGPSCPVPPATPPAI